MSRGARVRGVAAAAFLALLGACGGDSATGVAEPGTSTTTRTNKTRKGTYVVTWRPVGDSVPLNEHFSVEVEVERVQGSAPVTGAQVYLRCDMPAHGHGMNVEPVTVEVGAGRYRVEGVLLHMTGYWTVGIDVVVGGSAETADFELTLE